MYGQLVESPVLAAQSLHVSAASSQSPSAQQASAAAAAAAHNGAGKDSRQQQQHKHQATQQMGQEQHTEHRQPHLQALHVDGLYPDHIKLLSEPFEVFAFDFACPPKGDQHRPLQASLSKFELQCQ